MESILNTELIERLKGIDFNLQQIQSWCASIKHLMMMSNSTYANGRQELHIRHFVKLQRKDNKSQPEVKKISPVLCAGVEIIEALGEKLLPDFDQGLVLFYPKGTQIRVHRDSPAYAQGAAQINVKGSVKFSISGNQREEGMREYLLNEGDCIRFNNKQPHQIAPVTEDRWCICFFYLKPELVGKAKPQEEPKSMQLALF